MKKRGGNTKKNVLAASFTLAGTIIGAGILAIPYAFSQSGFLIGLFWLVVLGGIALYVYLALGEVSLRTKKVHQIPGYGEKYLGKVGKIILFASFGFGIYAALLAYLIGEGQSLSQLFFGNLEYSLYFVIGFWALMSLFLLAGLKGLKRLESIGVFAIIAIVLGIFTTSTTQINVSNLMFLDFSKFFIPFGVVLFSMLGMDAIPEMNIILKKNKKLMKRSILIGSLLPVILYFLFSFAFVSILGKNVQEVATLSFGSIIIILGIFTMMTSYFVLSMALHDSMKYDFQINKFFRLLITSALPLILFLIVHYLGLGSFVKIISIGGVISGGISGILILLMNKKSKKKGERKPEFSVPINWLIISIISLVFISGIIFEFLI